MNKITAMFPFLRRRNARDAQAPRLALRVRAAAALAITMTLAIAAANDAGAQALPSAPCNDATHYEGVNGKCIPKTGDVPHTREACLAFGFETSHNGCHVFRSPFTCTHAPSTDCRRHYNAIRDCNVMNQTTTRRNQIVGCAGTCPGGTRAVGTLCACNGDLTLVGGRCACPSGRYLALGTESQCVSECGVGEAPVDGKCQLCPAGHYKAAAGNAACSQCFAPASSAAENCPAGGALSNSTAGKTMVCDQNDRAVGCVALKTAGRPRAVRADKLGPQGLNGEKAHHHHITWTAPEKNARRVSVYVLWRQHSSAGVNTALDPQVCDRHQNWGNWHRETVIPGDQAEAFRFRKEGHCVRWRICARVLPGDCAVNADKTPADNAEWLISDPILDRPYEAGSTYNAVNYDDVKTPHPRNNNPAHRHRTWLEAIDHCARHARKQGDAGYIPRETRPNVRFAVRFGDGDNPRADRDGQGGMYFNHPFWCKLNGGGDSDDYEELCAPFEGLALLWDTRSFQDTDAICRINTRENRNAPAHSRCGDFSAYDPLQRGCQCEGLAAPAETTRIAAGHMIVNPKSCACDVAGANDACACPAATSYFPKQNACLCPGGLSPMPNGDCPEFDLSNPTQALLAELHAASPNLDTIRTRIGAGATLDYKHNGAPLLIVAATMGHAEAVSVLITAGADPNARTPDGQSVRDDHDVPMALIDRINVESAPAPLPVLAYFVDALKAPTARRFEWNTTHSSGPTQVRAIELLQNHSTAQGASDAEVLRVARLLRAQGETCDFDTARVGVLRDAHARRNASAVCTAELLDCPGGTDSWTCGSCAAAPILNLEGSACVAECPAGQTGAAAATPSDLQCGCADGNPPGKYGDCNTPRYTDETACTTVDPLVNPLGGTSSPFGFCLFPTEHEHEGTSANCRQTATNASGCVAIYREIRELNCHGRGLHYDRKSSNLGYENYCICPETGRRGPCYGPPDIPAAPVAAVTTHNRVALSWSAPHLNNSTLYHYEVLRQAGPAAAFVSIGIASSVAVALTLSGEPEDVNLKYKIRTHTEWGAGTLSAESNQVELRSCRAAVETRANQAGGGYVCNCADGAARDADGQCAAAAAADAALLAEIQKAEPDLAAIRAQIAAGGDVNLRHDGNPLLIVAATLGHAEAVSVLITAGADPDARSASGASGEDGAHAAYLLAGNPTSDANLRALHFFADALKAPTARSFDWNSLPDADFRGLGGHRLRPLELLQHNLVGHAKRRVLPMARLVKSRGGECALDQARVGSLGADPAIFNAGEACAVELLTCPDESGQWTCRDCGGAQALSERGGSECAAQCPAGQSPHTPAYPDESHCAECPDGGGRGEYGDCESPRLDARRACANTEVNPLGGEWASAWCVFNTEHIHGRPAARCKAGFVGNRGCEGDNGSYAKLRELRCHDRGLAYSYAPLNFANGLFNDYCVCPSGQRAPCYGPPEIPAAPTATVTADNRVKVSWIEPRLNNSTLSHYSIHRQAGTGADFVSVGIALSSTLTVTLTGEPEGVSLRYKIRTHTEHGAGSLSAESNAVSLQIGRTVMFSSSGGGTVSGSWSGDSDLRSGEAVPDGTTVTFTATPEDSNWYVSGWEVSGGGGQTCPDESVAAINRKGVQDGGAAKSCALVAAGAGLNVTAAFERFYRLEYAVDSARAGPLLRIGSVDYGGSIDTFRDPNKLSLVLTPPAGELLTLFLQFQSTHPPTEVVRVDSAPAGLCQNFVGHSNAVGQTSCVLTVNQGVTVSVFTGAPPVGGRVAFGRDSELGVISAAGGGKELESGDTVADGTRVTFTATPAAGYTVGVWLESCAGRAATGSPQCVLTADGGNLRANVGFVDINECAAGTHTCGARAAGRACRNTPGSFECVTAEWRVAFPSPSGGTIRATTAAGASLADGGMVSHGTTVTFTAEADTGYEFSAWRGDCAGTDAAEFSCALAVNADVSVGAVFSDVDECVLGTHTCGAGVCANTAGGFECAARRWSVAFSSSSGGTLRARTAAGAAVMNGGMVSGGTTVTFTATPDDDGWHVSGWQVSGGGGQSCPAARITGAGVQERGAAKECALAVGAALEVSATFTRNHNVEFAANDRHGQPDLSIENEDYEAGCNSAQVPCSSASIHLPAGTVVTLGLSYDGVPGTPAEVSLVESSPANLCQNFVGFKPAASSDLRVCEVTVDGDARVRVYAGAPLAGEGLVVFQGGAAKLGTLSAAGGGADLESGDSVAEGTRVTFTARPAAGYTVGVWLANCAGRAAAGSPQCVLTADGGNLRANVGFADIDECATDAHTCGAPADGRVCRNTEGSFECAATMWLVSFSPSSGGTLRARTAAGAAVSDGGMVSHGTTVTFTAAPDAGRALSAWLEDCAGMDAGSPCVLAVEADVTAGAAFGCEAGRAEINRRCVSETGALPETKDTCEGVFAGDWKELEGSGVCSEIDINDTFCLANSDLALSCRGLFNHVRRCNLLGRPALDPFYCAGVCASGRAAGAGCLE